MAVNTRSSRKERQREIIDLAANPHNKVNTSVKDFCSSSENCIPVAQKDTNMSNISNENDCSAPVEVSIRVVGSPQAESIRVRVHPDLEVEILERVVATAAYGSFDNRRIYLLFRESDSLGISLYDLARNALISEEMYLRFSILLFVKVDSKARLTNLVVTMAFKQFCCWQFFPLV